MTDRRQQQPLDERDFDAIEAAVMETERGRWFLGEFARRNRLAETRLLLDAMTRLEQSVAKPHPDEGSELVRREIAAMAATMSRALDAADGGRDGGAAGLDGLFAAIGRVEAATADIHDAAERVSETAWRLREAGASGELCGELDKAAADIATASAFGGLTAGRVKALAEAVRDIRQRLDALPPTWKPVPDPPSRRVAHPDSRPGGASSRAAKAGQARGAADHSPEAAGVSAPPSAPAAPAEPEARRRSTAPPVRMPVPSLAAFDGMDLKERLRLFT
ncbi:hypothetical protein [Enterovirga aerilata]|uniref:Uncharacterized protein n=1 Tax=Enterovirga aerilata TaxID=2730920 RepID=A0A849I2N6_9HYPH|nr:hypothetical protein [Enterovirga sp. DB1703]NNM71894.1 hypothetical protein [Enterovirga sp. DB1703]